MRLQIAAGCGINCDRVACNRSAVHAALRHVHQRPPGDASWLAGPATRQSTPRSFRARRLSAALAASACGMRPPERPRTRIGERSVFRSAAGIGGALAAHFPAGKACRWTQGHHIALNPASGRQILLWRGFRFFTKNRPLPDPRCGLRANSRAVRLVARRAAPGGFRFFRPDCARCRTDQRQTCMPSVIRNSRCRLPAAGRTRPPGIS